MLALIIMTLYWKIGDNRALSNYSNLTAVLFLWTILPGYAATAFIPTIVLERPLFVRCGRRSAPRALRAPPRRLCVSGPARRRALTGHARAASATTACTGPSRTWCSR